MSVKQISVFLENKAGRLADVTKVLGENHIDISALSIADTTHFGILRLIVNDPDRAEHVLRENGFTVSSSPVLAIAVDDVPGALSEALSALGLEYEALRDAYRVAVPNTAQATKLITEHPELFVDYEITKGKMDDVFLAVTGKALSGGGDS